MKVLTAAGLKEENPLTVAGWGVTREGGTELAPTLQEVNLPLVNTETCRAVLGPGVTDNMLCAGGVEGQDACQGDSGGPLMGLQPTQQRLFLAGVVSWGVGCAREGLYGVYTKVSRYTTWIHQYIHNQNI